MIGIDNIIENEVYTILVFISIEFIREEKSQRSIAKENTMFVSVSLVLQPQTPAAHTAHECMASVKALGGGSG